MSEFHFKEFTINQSRSALKVGTDSMLLGALIDCESRTNALDIGTGTGVLSMMVAQKKTDILITAVEIDVPSAQDAHDNFVNGPFANRIHLRNEDFLTATFNGQFDLIFTNPPFYVDALKTESSRVNQAKHVDALNSISLCEKVAQILVDNGDFWVIWPYQNREEFIASARTNHLNLKQEITLEGNPGNPVRTVFCFSKTKNSSWIKKKFLIRNEDGTYTDEYRFLTKDFHNRKV